MIYPYVANTRKDRATIEHLNYDGPFYLNDGLRLEDVALCCGSCNSSRGIKALLDWFKTPYCIKKHINSSTVATPVQTYLKRMKKKT